MPNPTTNHMALSWFLVCGSLLPADEPASSTPAASPTSFHYPIRRIDVYEL